MVRLVGVVDALDFLLDREELDDAPRVRDVASHAKRQRLQSLQDLEGRHGRHARAEIPQTFAARAQEEREVVDSSAKFMPWKPSYGSVSVGNLPEATQSMRPPSTSTPPITTPWPERNFRCGVHGKVRALLEGTPERGSGHRRVDE
jgi:hypothetical protein